MRIHVPIASLMLVLAGSAAAISPHEGDGVFRLARFLSDAEGGELWGVPLYGPMLLVDPMTREAVANEPDGEGHLSPVADVVVWAGTLPDDAPIANTAAEWAGKRWTMLMWPLPSARYARGKLVMHELFHRIQPEIGLPAIDATCGHLDREGRRWLRLEMRALSEALIRTGDARRQALADALDFRNERHELFPDQREAVLELNEGLSEYTGFMSSGLPEAVIADRVAMQLERYDSKQSFARSFAYATGPAYAVLLDAADPGWRERLDPNSDLSALTRAAYGIDPAAATDRAARAEVYGDVEIRALESARLASVYERERRYQARFVDGPTLTLPVMGEFHYGFDPNAVDGFGEHGVIYRGANVSDRWGSLEAGNAGLLLVRDANDSVTETVVPAPERADTNPILGDGYSLDLNDGFVLVPGERPGSYRLAGQAVRPSNSN